ncbi:MAG: eukaryotic-like serine/threonine-protein kinase [Actinomycetota bacterium]|nr:eukaryotic-like serine/threonine-protein kinase [Actinomycetota bacterium]
MSLVGQVFSNRYEIEREIARGGMAEVYLARDQSLNRPVALKALFPEFAREPSFVERFRREAQAAANLNHPNIVSIYDWGQESGTYFIVMEYVEGRSLRELIHSEGPLEAGQAADIAAEIASALAFAHRSGVVHRDVKPGNVLLTESGTVKVTDFGIARAGTSDGLTQTGSVMGTATYFSPEQAQGLAVDGRSDVYSVGVVLYEMVCGVPPFTAESPVSVAYKHVREEAIAPSLRNPDVPPALEQIILSALAKDPEHRYQSADDLRADILRFRRGRPLVAAPITAIVTDLPTTTVTNAGVGAYAAATVANPRIPVEPPPYGRKPRGSGRPAIYTLLTLLALALLVGGILLAAVKLGNGQKTVVVPNVVHKTAPQATQALAAKGLVPVTKLVASSQKINTVISQSPKAGDAVKRKSRVTISVSSGVGEGLVPDVTNKTVGDATKLLEKNHYVVKVDPAQSSSAVDPDHIISTNPPIGSTQKFGTTIHLIPSSGVTVPNVVNVNEQDASNLLTQSGLTVRPLRENSDTIPSGNVTRTNPPAGTSNLKGGSVIDMYVSTGAKTVAVPSVLGLSQSDATAALKDKGFESSVILDTTTLKGNDGKVLTQSPNAGDKATPGSTVVLHVGSYTAPTTTTKPTPTSTTTTTTAGP